MATTEPHTEETTEGGFGTGLRRQLEARAAVLERQAQELPRSPGEALAATPAPLEIPEGIDLDELRAELDASLGREQDLRESLTAQLETSARELQFDQEIAGRFAELEE